jgi:hypothetical protein
LMNSLTPVPAPRSLPSSIVSWRVPGNHISCIGFRVVIPERANVVLSLFCLFVCLFVFSWSGGDEVAVTDVVATVGWVQVHHITVKRCVVADRSPLSTRPRPVKFFTVSFVSGFNAEIWSSAGVLGWVQARWALERAGLKFRETKHVVVFHIFATACVGFSLSLSPSSAIPLWNQLLWPPIFFTNFLFLKFRTYGMS